MGGAHWAIIDQDLDLLVRREQHRSMAQYMLDTECWAPVPNRDAS
jgi:hypothetical protein